MQGVRKRPGQNSRFNTLTRASAIGLVWVLLDQLVHSVPQIDFLRIGIRVGFNVHSQGIEKDFQVFEVDVELPGAVDVPVVCFM